jgi:hypothetical protein
MLKQESMKWNWGTKLVLWMVAFMTLIIVFAVLMINEDVSLVETDYYPKGQTHQELIEKKHNANSLSGQITVKNNDGQLELQFPVGVVSESVSGELHLYHIADDKQDQFIPIKLNENGVMAINVVGLSGRFILKIDWKTASDKYYTELKISLP